MVHCCSGVRKASCRTGLAGLTAVRVVLAEVCFGFVVRTDGSDDCAEPGIIKATMSASAANAVPARCNVLGLVLIVASLPMRRQSSC